MGQFNAKTVSTDSTCSEIRVSFFLKISHYYYYYYYYYYTYIYNVHTFSSGAESEALAVTINRLAAW